MNTAQSTSTLLKDILKKESTLANLSEAQLVEKSIQNEEGQLSDTGALAVTTGKYTGRSPKDRFIVEEASVKHKVDWSSVNQPISEENFDKLYEKVVKHLDTKEELYTFKGYAGADEKYRLPLQVVSEYAWSTLFANQLFIRPTEEELNTHIADFNVLVAPHVQADPDEHGTNSETFIIISFERKTVLIGGSEYGGEIKKSIFSVMNYLLPEKHDVLSMHCSANVGEDDDVALFFGLSGTGKTTLSADPNRSLIGDDEHGWSDDGVFNIEGGCYAKCINLSAEKEPEIYNAIRFGSVLENVAIDEQTRKPDFDDNTYTENTRTAYSLEKIPNSLQPSMAGIPRSIVFLTADASGVLPPISKLTKEQAMYHFLSGYTSKLAGTERGVTSPEATFSTCFGAPFLPLPADRYAEMLGEKIEKYDVNVFLVNTGWTGGSYGTGSRMKLSYTRAMVQAALNGELDHVDTTTDAIFGLHIPTEVPNVPSNVLQPKQTWDDPEAYDKTARDLAQKFKDNFTKFTNAADAIKNAGPLV